MDEPWRRCCEPITRTDLHAAGPKPQYAKDDCITVRTTVQRDRCATITDAACQTVHETHHNLHKSCTEGSTKEMRQLKTDVRQLSYLQLLESLDYRFRRFCGALRISARHHPSISDMERVPDALRSCVCCEVSSCDAYGYVCNLHLAPRFAAASSIIGSFHVLSVSMICMSYSPSVVKPVIDLPLAIGSPVFRSTIPGNTAAPWHTALTMPPFA